ncbi:hypothetical protein NJ76_31730, partial [Rhodococcus sp. IITR03]
VVVAAGLVALTVTDRHVPFAVIATVVVVLVAGACALAQDATGVSATPSSTGISSPAAARSIGSASASTRTV